MPGLYVSDVVHTILTLSQIRVRIEMHSLGDPGYKCTLSSKMSSEASSFCGGGKDDLFPLWLLWVCALFSG